MRKVAIRLSILLLLTVVCTSCNFTDENFIRLFEEYTDLTFPESGKVKLNDNPDVREYLEDNYTVTFEVDTLDYNKILHEIQARFSSLSANDENITYSSFVLNKGIDSDEYAYYEEHRDNRGRRFRLSFDKDKRTIECNLESQ